MDLKRSPSRSHSRSPITSPNLNYLSFRRFPESFRVPTGRTSRYPRSHRRVSSRRGASPPISAAISPSDSSSYSTSSSLTPPDTTAPYPRERTCKRRAPSTRITRNRPRGVSGGDGHSGVVVDRTPSSASSHHRNRSLARQRPLRQACRSSDVKSSSSNSTLEDSCDADVDVISASLSVPITIRRASVGPAEWRRRRGAAASRRNSVQLNAALDTATRESSDDECSICKDEKVNRSVLLPCMHTYCYACISQWVRINPTCPLCKGTAERIIHSITSDRQFSEVSVATTRMHSTSVSPTGFVGQLMSPQFEMYEVSPRFLNRSLTPSSDIGQVSVLPPFHPSINSTTQDHHGVLLHAFLSQVFDSSVIDPSLVRRLVYTNNLYTFPIPPATQMQCASDLLTRSTSCSFLAQNEALHTRLIDFAQRELIYLAPWLGFAGRYESVTTAPLNAHPRLNEAVGRLATQIIRRVACWNVPISRVSEFADAVRQLDQESRNGAAYFDGPLLASVSDAQLRHFCWELWQFARFSGTIDEYYSIMCLFREHFAQDSQSELPPPINLAVYTSPRCGAPRPGIARPSGHFIDTLASWLFSCFFQNPDGSGVIPRYSARRLLQTQAISTACRQLLPLTLRDPFGLISGSHSLPTCRRRAARTLLVRFAERPWPRQVSQLALCELIDQARLVGASSVPSLVQNTAMRRFANLTLLFSPSPSLLSVGTPLPRVEDIAPMSSRFGANWTSLMLSPTRSSAEGGMQTIEVEDDDDDVVEIIHSEEISVSDSEEQRQQRPVHQSPRCCSVHTAHCCCCKRRTPTGNGVISLFDAFIHYFQQKERMTAADVVRLTNQPSSPIVISDDEDEIAEVAETEPQPGPSMPQVDDPSPSQVQDNDSTEDLKAESPIYKPKTADDFYALLHQLMNGDNNDSTPPAESDASINPPAGAEVPHELPRPASAP
ncbi:unnamed protein product [Mesocestoides corti]|uniref:RING-type E3 ubiquitin transferase n=1 Tax=Mesocestoides corti TaxID=53468 RepID=A0A0R3UF21_MESCO|nr:unnamed protein product [Mesocestoides corti]